MSAPCWERFFSSFSTAFFRPSTAASRRLTFMPVRLSRTPRLQVSSSSRMLLSFSIVSRRAGWSSRSPRISCRRRMVSPSSVSRPKAKSKASSAPRPGKSSWLRRVSSRSSAAREASSPPRFSPPGRSSSFPFMWLLPCVGLIGLYCRWPGNKSQLSEKETLENWTGGCYNGKRITVTTHSHRKG